LRLEGVRPDGRVVNAVGRHPQDVAVDPPAFLQLVDSAVLMPFLSSPPQTHFLTVNLTTQKIFCVDNENRVNYDNRYRGHTSLSTIE
jgi:hypothetical protein